MSTKSPVKVKPDAAEMPYFIHRSFARYHGRGAPRRNKRRRSPSYGEVCIIVWNDWEGGPIAPAQIDAWAKDFNWPVETLVAFIDEMRADGMFDLVHPEKGVRQ